MRMRFIGAAQQVTGSMHCLETGSARILIDGGLYQGRRDDSRQRNTHFAPEALEADALLLTHAHIDHSGNIPGLIKRGFRGTVYATPATRDLCAYMLRDSARIQEADARYLNRKNADDPDWKEITPLYDEEDAVRALERFVSVPYGKRFDVHPGVSATFLDAGHILGSASVSVDVAGAGKDKSGRRIAFSGDIGRKGLPILRDPVFPERPDYVLMESTYGNRAHDPITSTNARLAEVINATIKRKGKVLIPAFAVGRSQEIIYALNELIRDGRVPPLPVFVDSPLSVNVTEVFKLHPECFDHETRDFMEEHGDPFSFASVRYIQSVDESKRLNDLREPAVIIASSGMCEAGRILHHLRNNVEDERNTILIVGFQAQHTLGRRIVERRPRVKILGVERDLRARVEIMNGFSAHADKEELYGYAQRCAAGGATRSFFLVHGEADQQVPMAEHMNREGMRTVIPKEGDVHELE